MRGREASGRGVRKKRGEVEKNDQLERSNKNKSM